MRFELTSLTQIPAFDVDEIIDVRAPAEYAEDHVPGALSLPVLDDDERTRVGTLYTRVDRFEARKIGAALVARNAARHLETALADRPGGWRPLVYCWRGGQRSGSFASILAQIGWRVQVLEGGYRSYRRLVVEAMHKAPVPHPLVLLDGNTGTAKTEVLQALGDRGVQVVDLEGLARHRGSVFGHRGDQPSQKAFEGAVAMAFAALDPKRAVVVEAESSKVGNLQLPPSLWAAMRAAPRVRLAAPVQERARYLVRAYSDIIADRERLHTTLESLVPLQGREVVAGWRRQVAEGAFEALAEDLITRHYDPRYAKSAMRQAAPVRQIAVGWLNAAGIAGAAAEVERVLSEDAVLAAPR